MDELLLDELELDELEPRLDDEPLEPDEPLPEGASELELDEPGCDRMTNCPNRMSYLMNSNCGQTNYRSNHRCRTNRRAPAR
ncbi:MAG: hypothetical protein R2851_21205 [Caldilineaceae bacterium]